MNEKRRLAQSKMRAVYMDETLKGEGTDMRRVWVVRTVMGKDKFEEERFDGLFHQWGVEWEEFQDGGACECTVGIVEKEDGRITTVLPDHVQFLHGSSENVT